MPVTFPRHDAADEYLHAQAAHEALDRLRRLAREHDARRYPASVLDASAGLPAGATTYEFIIARGD
jgi:hypothetical protein